VTQQILDKLEAIEAATIASAASTASTDRTLRRFDRGGTIAVSTDDDLPLHTLPQEV
jgi:hypothetical protein